MRYLTDRKRADGLGSAKSGTEHHWHVMVSSVAMCGLIPLFIITFGAAYGGTYEEMIAYFSRPFPAIVALLTLLAGWVHFRMGIQATIEDYTGGLTRKALIIGMACFSYAAAATGVFAIARIAL